MHITLGVEIALSLHLTTTTSYTQLETALVSAGFTNYAIMRNVNSDDSTDVQLYLRGDYAPDGSIAVLAAGETMQKIADAVEALEQATEPDEEPQPVSSSSRAKTNR